MKPFLLLSLLLAGCETVTQLAERPAGCAEERAEVERVWRELEAHEAACRELVPAPSECSWRELRMRRAYTELWEHRWLEQQGCFHLH